MEPGSGKKIFDRSQSSIVLPLELEHAGQIGVSLSQNRKTCRRNCGVKKSISCNIDDTGHCQLTVLPSLAQPDNSSSCIAVDELHLLNLTTSFLYVGLIDTYRVNPDGSSC